MGDLIWFGNWGSYDQASYTPLTALNDFIGSLLSRRITPSVLSMGTYFTPVPQALQANLVPFLFSSIFMTKTSMHLQWITRIEQCVSEARIDWLFFRPPNLNETFRRLRWSLNVEGGRSDEFPPSVVVSVKGWGPQSLARCFAKHQENVCIWQWMQMYVSWHLRFWMAKAFGP